MAGAFVADSTGVYRTAKTLWVADGTGTYRVAKALSVAGSDGTYHGVSGLGGPSVFGLTVQRGTPSYQKAVLTWTGNAPGGYKVFLAGSSTALYTGTASTFTYTGAPNTKYSFRVRAYAADGVTYGESDVVSITLDLLAAPQNFRRSSGDSVSSSFAWNSVTGSTGYDLVDTLTSGQPVKASVTGTTRTETGLNPSTVYERAVRAKLNAAVSTLSNKVRYTTPARTGPAAGTYTFSANSQTAAFAYGTGQWRAPSDGIIHGNGAQWGSTYGSHKTFFIYGNHPFSSLKGGRVTRFKIIISRDSQSGSSAAQDNTFQLHNYTVRPLGEPGSYNPITAGSLAWGQEGAFDLPVSWAQGMIDDGVISGIVWGFNGTGRYMRGSSPVVLPEQGQLSITIG